MGCGTKIFTSRERAITRHTLFFQQHPFLKRVSKVSNGSFPAVLTALTREEAVKTARNIFAFFDTRLKPGVAERGIQLLQATNALIQGLKPGVAERGIQRDDALLSRKSRELKIFVPHRRRISV
jgi:hypothetical protein